MIEVGKKGAKGLATEKALQQAGIRLMAQYGFEAMNLRMLAREVGIKAGSLYHHIESKEDLLYTLLSTLLTELIAEFDGVMQGIEDPVEQLKAFVACHINSHTRRREELFIAGMELRSLSKEKRKVIIGMRRDYEQRITHIIRRGRQLKCFRVANDRVATFALVSMLNGICVWFRPDGPVQIDELIAMYTDMALGALGATSGALRRSRRSV